MNKVKLFSKELSGSIPSIQSFLLCVTVNHLALLFIDMPVSDPLFVGEESHLVLYGGDLQYKIDIEMEFKPNSLFGLLFYSAQRFSEESGDFLAISMYDGQVHLRVSFGGHNLLVLTSGQRLFTGVYYITSQLQWI